MYKPLVVILLFSLVLLAFLGCVSKTEIENRIPALDYLDRKLNSWVEKGYYNGVAIKAIQGNDVFFESYYGGYSDTTALHVASAGKWIAAATIASIVDEGLLSWDDKVNKYIPEFIDIKGEATLCQLLSHTAGYPDYQPKDKRKDDYQTLEEAVSQIVCLAADTIPGTKYQYGGLSMQVAGRMAELVTGQNWEDLFQNRIAIPLKMKNSHFVPVSEEGGFSPMLGGGFRTSLSDYMSFLKMFMNYGVVEGKQVLSKESIIEIESDQIKAAYVQEPTDVALTRQKLHTDIYGLGCWREDIDASGNTLWVSSPGWAGAYPWVDRENNIYGFVLAKVNGVARKEGFSSFYESMVVPQIIRDGVQQQNVPKGLERGKINTGEANLYYEELGEGEPVIFLHGHSLDHRMWDKQFEQFAKSYRTIRFDFRGYGYSSSQREGEQFTHIEDLIELMDILKIEKAHIVGLSLGGYVAADMLGWFPERILSATLASGNVRLYPKPSIPMGEEESLKRDVEIAALKQKGIDVMKREWFDRLMKSAGTQKENMRHQLWDMIYQWDAWQPLHKEARVIAGGDAYDRLKENNPTIPVLIIEGKSKFNRYSNNPEILKYLPLGKFIIMKDCGHMLNMERPEEFNNLVLEFIKSN